jgi:gluconokinase
LAARLNAPFLEGDDFHSSANRDRMGAGIALRDADRWPWLDSVGDAAGRVAREHGRVVVACSALKHGYRDRLRQAMATPVCFVCLVGEHSLLVKRLRARREHFMPVSLLASQIDTLELPDAAETAICLDAGESAQLLVDRILAFSP